MEPKDIIKNARDAKGLTQAQLAKATGVSSRMIQRYEEGLFPKYKSEKIRKVDSLLGTQVYDMIYDKNKIGLFETKPNQKQIIDNNLYLELLESNDRFFKNEYAQLLLSLNKLIDLGKKSEALIKLNLEHIGNIEAQQQGVSPEEIHAQINNQIAEIGPSE